MFESIAETWRKTKAAHVRSELEDALRIMGGHPETTTARTAVTLLTEFKAMRDTTVNFTNCTPKGLQKFAKGFRKVARERYDTDVGQAFGLALLAMFLESMTMSEDDAEMVRWTILQMIRTANEVAGNPLEL